MPWRRVGSGSKAPRILKLGTELDESGWLYGIVALSSGRESPVPIGGWGSVGPTARHNIVSMTTISAPAGIRTPDVQLIASHLTYLPVTRRA
jgi:hypothetical protein